MEWVTQRTTPAAASPRSRTPAHPESAPSPSYLAALRDLENPVSSSVLHIADTLTSSAAITTADEDAIAAENLRFLRSPTVDPQEEWRAENAREESFRERQRTVLEHRAEERERRERMFAVMNRLDRLRRLDGLNPTHSPNHSQSRIQSHPHNQSAQSNTYGERVPNWNSLYDWSPSAEANGAEDELQHLVRELQQRNQSQMLSQSPSRSQSQQSHSSRHLRSQPESAGAPPSQSRAFVSRFLSNNNQTGNSSESSLRATAIAQSVRRHSRAADRSRQHYMQRYIAMPDRESTTQRQPEPLDASSNRPAQHDRFSPRHPGISVREPSRYENNRRAWLAEQALPADYQYVQSAEERARFTNHPDPSVRVEHYRRSYLTSPSSNATQSPPIPTPHFEQTINYLSNLRSSTAYEDSIMFAIEAGFLTKEFFGDHHDDFLLDLSDLPGPSETSWLKPGAVLSGSQHATPVNFAAYTLSSTNQSSHDRNLGRIPSSAFINVGDITVGNIPPHARRAPEYQPHTHSTDRWPVKVSIHAVDYEKCTLSATMEAYNVPSQPAVASDPPNLNPGTSSRTSSITTYLEGEMLDFRRTGFLTEAFASSVETDATYWRKLEPFAEFDDRELARRLTSKSWMAQICQTYVFMRWKERCFVKGSSTMGPRHPSANTWAGGNYSSTPAASSGAVSHVWHDGEYASMASDDNFGLTISGFYYVCLRRSDGKIEGLYHDKQSSPYQHLKLTSVRGAGGGVWQFR